MRLQQEPGIERHHDKTIKQVFAKLRALLRKADAPKRRSGPPSHNYSMSSHLRSAGATLRTADMSPSKSNFIWTSTVATTATRRMRFVPYCSMQASIVSARLSARADAVAKWIASYVAGLRALWE
jgi:hypothetical protein